MRTAWRNLPLVRYFTHADTDLNRPEERRGRVLAWMLLVLILLVFVIAVEVLLFTSPVDNRRRLYLTLTLGLMAVLLLAFWLNYRGRYALAAMLTVSCALIGPWISILFDRTVLNGDTVPMVYTALSLFLCAILLSMKATVILSLVQFAGLLTLSQTLPTTTPIDWPSLMAFILFSSALSIVSTMLSRGDIAQIDQQNRQLAQSEQHMRKLSVIDSLTGLYNRRYMDEALTQELVQAQAAGTPLGIIMADVDHFKHYNDQYGHMAGDALLQRLSANLRAHIRGSDIACRYGGEEFVLILPGAELDVVIKRAELIRESVHALLDGTSQQTNAGITLSLGLAVFPKHGCNANALLCAADAALYNAKKAGRNCARTAGQEESSAS